LGSSFKPDVGKLDVGRPHFGSVRFARPSEALFRHCPIFGGRFHNNNASYTNSDANFTGFVCIARDLLKVIHSPL
jgi:hypothetical protein